MHSSAHDRPAKYLSIHAYWRSACFGSKRSVQNKNIRAIIYLCMTTRSTCADHKWLSMFFLITATLLVAHLAFSFWTKLKMSFSSFCCHFNSISYWFGKGFFHFYLQFLAENVETAKSMKFHLQRVSRYLHWHWCYIRTSAVPRDFIVIHGARVVRKKENITNNTPFENENHLPWTWSHAE